jgi:4-hydroxy-3-polyprenylbenzoate decarboxylase
MNKLKKFIVAMTGASGSIYGIRILENLVNKNYDISLIVSENAQKIIQYETGKDLKSLASLATRMYANTDNFSPLASGTFHHNGMVIAPCTLKTLAGIANGYTDSLIARAALCTIKENHPLILVIRETPLDLATLTNLVAAKKNGAIILPAIPAFYHKPTSINELVDYVVGKVLDQLGIQHSLFLPWNGGK